MTLSRDAGGLLREGNEQYHEYCATGALVCLNEAINLTEEAVRSVPKSNASIPTILSNLSVFYRERSILTTSPGDLEEAIRLAQQAVDLTPEGDLDRPSALTNLSNGLEQRFMWKGQMEDLERAVAASEEAVKTAAEDDAGLYIMWNNLAKQLGERYVQCNKVDDLEDAIKALIRARDLTPEAQLGYKADILHNLGVRLQDRFLESGYPQDLEEAIQTAQDARDVCPRGYKNAAIIASELANRLGARYTRTQEQDDLDQAIRLNMDALRITPPNHEDRAMILQNLANRLRDKYSRTKNREEHLEPAISHCKESLALTGTNDTHRPRRLNSLAMFLYQRYFANEKKDHEDLDTAIALGREAITITKTEHSHYAGWAHDLSLLLAEAGKEHVDEAVQWAEIAVDKTPKGHSERAAWLVQLASLLQTRIGEDQKRAKEYFIEALSDDACPIGDRITAGRRLLMNADRFFLQHGEQEEAYRIAQEIIKLISLFSPRHFRNADKQHVLTGVVGLASEAAAVALEIGKEAVAALQLLEDGRGVLLGSLYDLRSNIEALEREHRDLAFQFRDLRERLNAPPLPTNDLGGLTGSNPKTLPRGDGRREIGKAMEALIQNIRNQPGFEQFLLPPSKSDLLTAAAEGPVVVLNISQLRCDALIIGSSGIKCLPLPHVNHRDVKRLSADPVSALSWLWDNIVDPVFDFLGFATKPTDDQWPRVWWVPTGALIKFPLHAAGHHLKPDSVTALDRAISSYSPSVKSIIHGRQRKGREARTHSSDGRKLVLITMEKTPSLARDSHLIYAPEETDAVRLLGTEMHLSCVSPACYKTPVLTSLQNCGILHFAGHGSTHLTQPLESHLLLQDWETDPLTVQSLLDIDLASNPPFLAYLSACGSGQVADDQSVDESIHLSSAFQLAGFRHVIGTLWEVDDKQCVDMARLVYKGLKRDGLTDLSVSAGLHHATRSLRDDWVREVNPTGGEQTREWGRPAIPPWKKNETAPVAVKPALWVPYVHYGV